MKDKIFFNHVRDLCLASMTYEVMAGPKPGLVDRLNNGAHKDMDLFTFIDSIISLKDYFYEISKLGYQFNNDNYTVLMEDIRPLGIQAEKTMFQATQGVNTHKGLIFLMGIIAAASGNLYRKTNRIEINPRDLSNLVSQMTRGITRELKTNIDTEKITYGERIYKEHKILGIRGEVEKGLPTVMNISYPLFKRLMDNTSYGLNTAMIHTLISLMTVVDDINILGRHGMPMLDYVRARSSQAIKYGGFLRPKGRKYVKYMDKDFIDKNISPGGSADLLAVTLLIYFLEKGSKV